MPIYIDESGGLSSGAMTMAAVEIDTEDATRLLDRFRTITGLRGELKGSRIDLAERGLFFELLERFGGRARICIADVKSMESATRITDRQVYVGMLRQLVEDSMPETAGCTDVVVDEGRYDPVTLEQIRREISGLLASFGTARLMDSARSPGIQAADVVANSYYNIAAHSNKARRISAIVHPFEESRILRTSGLRTVPGGEPSSRKSPATSTAAGL